MNKKILGLVLVIFGMMLTGCKTNTTLETMISAQESSIVTTAETAMPETSVETTIPETTEAEIFLEPDCPVTADGDLLESGSIISDGQVYVKATEFMDALDNASYSGTDALGFSLVFDDSEMKFRPENPLCVNGIVSHNENPVILYRDNLYIPLKDVCDALEISILDDDGHLYCTSGIMNIEFPDGINIPILMYHAVSDEMWGYEELFVSPSDLEEQLAFLVENGYDPIWFHDLDHLEDYDKPVMLTFDDGYMDNYLELYPLLEKYQVKATIFIITDVMGVSEVSMTTDQVKELSDSGLVSIQSHTCTHQKLSSLSYEEQLAEIRDSKYAVTRMTGREPFVLCYPSGERNQDTLDITPEYYDFGIDMTGGLYTTGDDPFRVSRYYISRYTSIWEFESMVSNAGD